MKLRRLLVAALLFAGANVFAVTPPARPNIIVILSDDMGYSDLGCYGGEIATPNLDALAASGVRFTQFYNNARCCPSRASLLTGLYAHQTGIGHMVEDRGFDAYRGDLNRRSLTIAEALKPAGYRSYAIGKWHVTAGKTVAALADKHNWPLQRGFDRYYGTINGSGSFWDPHSLIRDNREITIANDPEYHPADYHYTDAIADQTTRFIREHVRDHAAQPFFAYVAFGYGVMPGAADTFIAYGRGWANVSNTPFREFKHWNEEGGISTPLIVHWPKGIAAPRHGQLESQPSHLIDLMATCVDLAGANYPSQFNGETIRPLEGVSLRPTFAGNSLVRAQPIFWEHEGNRAVRDGQWKLVSKHPGDWRLYDLEADRTEQHDLAAAQPDRAKQLLDAHRALSLHGLGRAR